MKKLNDKGFGWLELVLFLAFIGIIGFVGYRIYDNRNIGTPSANTNSQNSGELETLKRENVALKEDIDQLVEGAVQSTGVRNTDDQKAIELGNQIQQASVDFYKQNIRENLSEKQVVDYSPYKKYMTAAGYKSLSEPRSYNLIVCGQMKRFSYLVTSPTVSGDTATVPVLTPDYNDNEGDETITLKLVKQSDKWLIDSISCLTL